MLDVATRVDDAAGDARDGISVWRDLVEGRASVVARFDGDGRRFLVVRENAPELQADLALSPRERSVVSHARLGRSNKLIAYELGLAESTISTVLRAAATKLGARSRLELVRLLTRIGQDLEPGSAPSCPIREDHDPSSPRRWTPRHRR